jgi:presenilin-like A22 family membrane protease
MQEEASGQTGGHAFEVRLEYLFPQVWVLVLTGALSIYLVRMESYRELLTLFPETPEGASLNSLTFVLPLFASATIMYLLVRSRHLRVVKLIVRISLVLATFLLTTWYIFKIVRVLPISIPTMYVSTLASACLTALMLLAVYKAGGLMQAFALASIGALIGTFLAFSIPTLSAVVLLGALVVYDVLSVYKGPIGRLVENVNLKDFAGMVFTLGDVTVGMGDMVFYSMLVSVAISNFGVFSYVMTSLGVLGGTYVGMRLLRRWDYLPGLPLAILGGLVLMFLSALMFGKLT